MITSVAMLTRSIPVVSLRTLFSCGEISRNPAHLKNRLSALRFSLHSTPETKPLCFVNQFMRPWRGGRQNILALSCGFSLSHILNTLTGVNQKSLVIDRICKCYTGEHFPCWRFYPIPAGMAKRRTPRRLFSLNSHNHALGGRRLGILYDRKISPWSDIWLLTGAELGRGLFVVDALRTDE